MYSFDLVRNGLIGLFPLDLPEWSRQTKSLALWKPSWPSKDDPEVQLKERKNRQGREEAKNQKKKGYH